MSRTRDGWYQDPLDSSLLRLWENGRWTAVTKFQEADAESLRRVLLRNPFRRVDSRRAS